jgi:hypothetical protein
LVITYPFIGHPVIRGRIGNARSVLIGGNMPTRQRLGTVTIAVCFDCLCADRAIN